MTKRIFSLTLVVIMLFSMMSSLFISASAATSYDCKSTRVITVKTGKSSSTPSIKFVCKGDKWAAGYRKSDAPIMSLEIYDHTAKTTSWKRITGAGTSISSTLKLKANRTYTVKVSYLYDKKLNYDYEDVVTGKAWNIGHWYISSTKNISSYKIK